MVACFHSKTQANLTLSTFRFRQGLPGNIPGLMHAPSLLVLLVAGLPFLAQAAATVQKTAYHSWPEAFTIRNDTVEATVIPAIGRVMQFKFLGTPDGPFWENRALDGQSADSKSSEWINFGGEKTWPAPQADWAKMTGRGWPPPAAFDSMPFQAAIEDGSLVLTSPVDPHYGIQIVRRLTLDRTDLRISTTYRKREGQPVRVSIWTIAQLKDPERVYMPVPSPSRFAKGYNEQSDKLPAGLDFKNNVVSCTRATNHAAKIGSDASRLLWAGRDEILETIAPREKSGEFPDRQSSAEIYTNPDPLPYVELEMLGPLHELESGQSISRDVVYRLHKRPASATEREKQLEALLK